MTIEEGAIGGFGAHVLTLASDLGLTDAGLNPRKIVEFAPAGELVGRFFFIADPDGYQIEVLQRAGRFK